MAAKQPLPTPFTKHEGWRLHDLSLSLNGKIAVTVGKRRYGTAIDVYSAVINSRDEPKILYSKEFKAYHSKRDGWEYWLRCVSFVEPNDDSMILTCIGDKLELFDMKEDRAIKTCEVKLINHGWVTCMSVRENHVFIGFHQSHKITVYDLIDLNETQSIILHGMQICNHPCDMTVTTDRIYACINEGKKKGYQKTIIFGDKNGRMETLSELKEPIDGVRLYAWAITVNITLGVIAVAWSQNLDGTRKEKDAIAFYSLSSENVSSFLTIDVDVGVDRIRISDKGDRMVTGNYETGGVKFYDTADFLTYDQLKQTLASELQVDDWVKLMKYFALSEQPEAIINSGTLTENFLLVLEERGVIQLSNVDRLIGAFSDLNISSSCYHLVDFYKRTRSKY